MDNSNKDLFELMLSSNDDNEQFPVLKAFQSYLDAEREKARRRQSQITICFLVSTIILVVCFCVVGFAFFSKFIEKDNQMTQLLLLERAGIRQIPQEQFNQPSQSSIAPDKSAELAELISEIKKEREALESLKAELLVKQQQLEASTADEPFSKVEAPASVSPKNEPPVQEVKQENSVVPVATTTSTTIPTTTSTTTTTTSTTTTSTTTTTTLPPGPSVVEVVIPRDLEAKSVTPDGYSSDVMGIITGNNVSLPWHILLPNAK
ncbi:MAG: hypothetical protein IJ444_01410 [Kiritimatiellae bacterium]|nr:hypothetical protein [Kiritimatiellia bacterium]